uniref:Uncharacterized protein n=1 Tax=Magnetococcus massalia (strain MO-1) TaxID=451514 RepID=A0A1S7LIR4_MAGMO|nr:conserved protein of unknown function [Candidatus Magnetococcus massalia]
MRFDERIKGTFDGLFRLEDAQALGVHLEEMGDWYICTPEQLGEQIKPSTGHEARELYETLVAEILKVERGTWSTMVYVQEMHDPALIKVYHPKRSGCGCGSGGGILPWYLFSQVEPMVIPEWQKSESSCVAVANTSQEPRKGWLQRLRGK